MQICKLRISVLGFCSFLAISGCSGGGVKTATTSTGGMATAPTAMAGIYLLNNGVAFTGEPLSPTSILVYPKTANGAVAPTTVITAPANFSCGAIAVDSTGNVYLGGQVEYAAYGGQTILVYAPGASTPTRTITPAEFPNSAPHSTIDSLAVDGSGNIYVAGNLSVGGAMTYGVAEYASTATGSASAMRVISGVVTTITPPIRQIAVDSAGNLYIAPFQAGSVGASILVFNSMATGNVAPTATLGGPGTEIYDPGGVAVDKAGNIYVDSEAANISTPTGTFPGADSIFVFAAGSTGNVAPTRTISGSATMLERRNLAVDMAGNVYTVTGFAQVIAFSPTATGNVAPSAAVSSSAGAASFDSYVIATF